MELYDKFGDQFRDLAKVQTLLSARQRSNNYLEFSKENVLGNMILLH